MLSCKEKRSAFAGFALRHADSLYRFAFYLTSNEADAEDLTQDTFHHALKNFHQFQEGTDMRAWLFRIARNAHIDRLRRKAHEPVLSEMEDVHSPRASSEEGLLGSLGWEPNRWKGSAIDREDVFYDLFGDEVNRFLSELPPEFRLALVLCDVEELSYQEIAQVLACPVGTVRSRISRARSLLRDKLYQYAKSLGYVKEKTA